MRSRAGRGAAKKIEVDEALIEGVEGRIRQQEGTLSALRIRSDFEREETRDLLKAVMKKRGQPPGKISRYSTGTDSLRTMAQTNMVQGLI